MEEFIGPTRQVAEQMVTVATKSQAAKAELETTNDKLASINARLKTATEVVVALVAEYDQVQDDAKNIKGAVEDNAAIAETAYGQLNTALGASENSHAKEAVGMLGALAGGIRDTAEDVDVSVDALDDSVHDNLDAALELLHGAPSAINTQAVEAIALTAEEIGVQGTLAFAIQDALHKYLNDIA
jgi:hypothetical protein